MTTGFNLLASTVLMVLVGSMASATTFPVTTTADNGDNTTPTPGSLRAAIQGANFDFTATLLSPHIIDATGISGTISLPEALPNINNHMAIQGPGATTLTVTRGAVAGFVIFAVNAGTSATFSGLSITNGLAVGGTGILANGIVTVNDCNLSGNHATLFGTIYNNGSTLTVNNSTIADNESDYGGSGIYTYGGTVTVNNSTIANNNVDFSGGGMMTDGGGALFVTNSTISGNTCGDLGGGVFVALGTLTLRNTIIAGNTAPVNRGPDVLGAVTSLGNNLIGNTSNSSGWVASDIQNQDPLLDPLQFNGGPTRTMALSGSSPAINMGSDAVLLPPYDFTTDQRGPGYARKTGSSVDIGAFEFGSIDMRLPVELIGFDLSSTNSTIRIAWRTASEVDNAGFELQRATGEDADFTAIASYLSHPQLAGLGTSSVGKSYVLTDEANGPGMYRYRLVDITTDGIRTTHPAKSIRIDEDSPTDDISFLQLQAPTPNPASNELRISYTLAEAMSVSLEIYTADGRLVATSLKDENRSAGSHSQSIDVERLTPGTYTLRLVAGAGTRVRRFVVLR